jgi:hypothetical protein
MTKTIKLVSVEQGIDGMTVNFSDKSYINRNPEELIAYAEEQLETSINAVLRSLLLLDWVANGNVNITGVMDSEQVQGLWVVKNG